MRTCFSDDDGTDTGLTEAEIIELLTRAPVPDADQPGGDDRDNAAGNDHPKPHVEGAAGDATGGDTYLAFLAALTEPDWAGLELRVRLSTLLAATSTRPR
jgi:hypothetical protein